MAGLERLAGEPVGDADSGEAAAERGHGEPGGQVGQVGQEEPDGRGRRRQGVTLKNGRESTPDGTDRERDQAASVGRNGATAPRSGLNPSGPKVPSAPQR